LFSQNRDLFSILVMLITYYYGRYHTQFAIASLMKIKFVIDARSNSYAYTLTEGILCVRLQCLARRLLSMLLRMLRTRILCSMH